MQPVHEAEEEVKRLREPVGNEEGDVKLCRFLRRVAAVLVEQLRLAMMQGTNFHRSCYPRGFQRHRSPRAVWHSPVPGSCTSCNAAAVSGSSIADQ